MAACAGEEPSGTQSQPTEQASPSPTTTAAAEPECADLTGSPVAQITMQTLTFNPFCAIVSGDQKLEFVNEGKSRHSFTTPELDFDVLSGKTKTTKQPIGEVLKPGGTYAYECKYHASMNGELRVE
jgi:plastocyanin